MGTVFFGDPRGTRSLLGTEAEVIVMRSTAN